MTTKPVAPALDNLPMVASTPQRMSYEAFLDWAHEDIHAEWDNGEVFVHMPPKSEHQRIVGYLYELLSLFVRLLNLGQVISAPFEMRLGGAAWEPDILVLRRENLKRLTDVRLEGPADLVIEVVSDESVRRDRDKKFGAYQSGGVSEYWVADSRPGRHRVDFYALDETGTYHLLATEDDERVASQVLPGLWLKPAWLWAENPPSPLEALCEIAGLPVEVVAQLRTALEQNAPSQTDSSAEA